MDVTGWVGDHQVAARRERSHQLGHDPVRIFVVLDEVQDSQQHQGRRLGQIQRLGCGPHDRDRVAHIAVDVLGGTLRAAGQQRPCVGEHDGVVIDVDDPRVRRDRLGDLVGVVRRRNAGADIEELPDSCFVGQVADRPGQERPVRPDPEPQARRDGQYPLSCLAVGGEIVLAA
jgi:hypothetical protein